MLHELIAAVVWLAVGFGLGRIKNAAKLARISAVIDHADASATAEAKQAVSSLTAEIRKHV
jgi:hypothetical protein